MARAKKTKGEGGPSWRSAKGGTPSGGGKVKSGEIFGSWTKRKSFKVKMK